ncbi:MAG TPA: alpha/beta hydrolase-fold protein [Dictyobacter sp.]|nr:alpha/beta hydrolase-fold protein [Dictyobacter sp.]
MIEIHGCKVTFYPPAGAAYLMGDFTDWDETPLPISAAITLEFPPGAYIEYAFLDAQKRPVADPDQLQRPEHAWYEYHRCVTLPGNMFTAPSRSVKLRGQLIQQTLTSKVFGTQRTCYLYEPCVPPQMTLYVQDGEAYYQRLRFHEVVDALLEQGAILPVRLVMLEPHDRVREYWFNHAYEAFLLDEVMPHIAQRFGVTAQNGLWGASLGGLVSVWLAWQHPHLFSVVGSQSGCFTATPQGNDPHHDPEWLTAQFARTPTLPVRFYLDTGQIEWLLAPNRRFAALLADKKYTHYYAERPSGHTWATWEQGLVPGVRFLIPSE